MPPTSPGTHTEHERVSPLDLDRPISAVENIASLLGLIAESPDFAAPEYRGLSWLADRLVDEANELRRIFDSAVATNVAQPS